MLRRKIHFQSSLKGEAVGEGLNSLPFEDKNIEVIIRNKRNSNSNYLSMSFHSIR
jgi:hypothetical protein